jgi:hypothetical protein
MSVPLVLSIPGGTCSLHVHSESTPSGPESTLSGPESIPSVPEFATTTGVDVYLVGDISGGICPLYVHPGATSLALNQSPLALNPPPLAPNSLQQQVAMSVPLVLSIPGGTCSLHVQSESTPSGPESTLSGPESIPSVHEFATTTLLLQQVSMSISLAISLAASVHYMSTLEQPP